MPRSTSGLIPHEIRDAFKWEIASELGLTDQILTRGWAETTSRDCGRIGGKIGGNMVKVMIQYAQQALANQKT